MNSTRYVLIAAVDEDLILAKLTTVIFTASIFQQITALDTKDGWTGTKDLAPLLSLTEITRRLTMNKTEERKLPFGCVIMDEAPVKVTNRMSGESCMLEPDAVAVYDTIKGCELVGDYTVMRKGLDWFRKYFPAEYMVLLD